MVNDRLRDATDSETGGANSPAEVNFLHVGEKFGVEASEAFVKVGAHEERGAAGPVDVGNGVVLRVVRFARAEYSSPTIWIAVTV